MTVTTKKGKTMMESYLDGLGTRGGHSTRLLAHQDAKQSASKAAGNEGPIISLDRAQQALRTLNMQSSNETSEDKDRAARVLSEFMEERGARATAVSGGSGLGKSAATPAPAALTQADIDAAFARGAAGGVASERSRIKAVFDCKESRGRERGCAALLIAPQGWSASAITRELANLPIDRETAAEQSRDASSARWDKANAAVASKAEQILANQRAFTGRPPKEQSAAPALPAETKSQERWTKANAKAEQILAHQRAATGKEN